MRLLREACCIARAPLHLLPSLHLGPSWASFNCGDPVQAASFVASCGKVLRALGREAAQAGEPVAAHRGQAGSGDGSSGCNGDGGGDSIYMSSTQAGSDVLTCTLATAAHFQGVVEQPPRVSESLETGRAVVWLP